MSAIVVKFCEFKESREGNLVGIFWHILQILKFQGVGIMVDCGQCNDVCMSFLSLCKTNLTMKP